MTTWTTIVNGAAGGGRCASRSAELLGKLRDAGLELDVHPTERPGHATEIVRNAHGKGARQFILVGGDGTTFESINGLFPTADGDTPSTVGFLPLGTGNSFLRDFGIVDTQGAIDALIRGKSQSCDVVRVTHRDGELFYINLLSVGFSARVGALTNRRFKGLGALGYPVAVLASIVRLEYSAFPLTCNGNDATDLRQCTLLSFSNSRFTGGTMMMAPMANVSDGLLDLVRVGPLGRLGLIGALPRIYKGTHIQMKEVEHRQVRGIEFQEELETDCMVDGEVIRLAIRAIDVIPSSLEVII